MNAIGNDLLVILWGGTEPHIGAIGMGQPRNSLRDPEKISATGSVFTFIGHKDDVVAKWMSEELARTLNKKVVVSCGMHWDDLTNEGIDEVLEICKKMEREL
jgi:gallate decarboxylase subunit D